MASPDHAAIVREAIYSSVRAIQGEGEASLDALVVALAQAEQDRDEAIEALRTIHTSPICFIDCTERVGAVLATLNPHAA